MPSPRFLMIASAGLFIAAAICSGDDTSPEQPQQEIARLKAELVALKSRLAELQQEATPPRERYPDSYHAFTGAYPTTSQGVTKLPSAAVWEVVPSDGGGLDKSDPRIMMRLHDRRINFLSVTAQMNIATAQKLHVDLGKMIQSRLTTHGSR